MARQDGPRGFEMREESDRAAPAPELAPAPEGFTFASLLLSLSTSALMHMGVAPRIEADEEPETATPVNLPAAQQVIDILEMLEDKTKGNLAEDEQKLLGNTLHDLRMRFVEVHSQA